MSPDPQIQRNVSAVLVLVFLAASLAAASVFTVWRMRSDALDQGVVVAGMHVRNFEEHLTRILQVIEITAGNIAPAELDSTNPAMLNRQLDVILRPLPYIRSLSLLDGQGRIYASSNPGNVGKVVDTGNFFPAISPSAQLLRIGPPWRGRDLVSAAPAMVSSPSTSDASSFIPVLLGLGVPNEVRAVVAINPDYFVNHWTQLLEPGVGHVQWLRYDDILLGSSSATDLPGRHGAAGEVGKRLGTIEHGELAQTLPDGREVLTAYRASSRFPAVLAVHIDRNHIIAAWQDKARWVATIVIPILFALFFAALLLRRRNLRILAQQREIEHERQLAASFFEASNSAIVISDPDGKIITVNAAFERDTGYSREEAIGQTTRILKSGLNAPETYAGLWSTIAQGSPWRGELLNRRKSGEVYWESVVISPVFGAEGKIAHYVASMEDINDRKRFEEAMQRSEEKFSKAFRMSPGAITIASIDDGTFI